MKSKSGQPRNRVTAIAVMLSLLIWPLAAGTRGAEVAGATAAQQQSSAVYSGRATVVNATALGQQIVLSDTGPLPSKGGAQEASLLTASVPNLLTAEALHASTVAHGDRSRSGASVADLSLTVNGNLCKVAGSVLKEMKSDTYERDVGLPLYHRKCG